MKRVLVVEDDSFLNKMLSYNLTADGYEITSVLNARTAAQALNSKEFDLVLLDIRAAPAAGSSQFNLKLGVLPSAAAVRPRGARLSLSPKLPAEKLGRFTAGKPEGRSAAPPRLSGRGTGREKGKCIKWSAG